MPVDPRALGDSDLNAMHDVLSTVAAHDHPDLPVMPRGDLAATLSRPWPGTRVACWLSSDDSHGDSQAAGLAWVTLPGDANAAFADLTLAVRPAHRRQGTGRALLREAVRLAYATGRTAMIASAPDLDPATEFAATIGARPVLRGLRAVLQLPTRPTVAEVPLKEYELFRLRGAAPPELRERIGDVHQGMADAPAGDGSWVHQPHDGARVTAADVTLQARGMIQLRVLARHRRTDEVVGATSAIISPRSPFRSEQGDTTVLAPHRGNGLALAMSVELLSWLSGECPDVLELNTRVARENAPMLAVNSRLGYRVVGPWTQWQASVRDLAGTLGLV